MYTYSYYKTTSVETGFFGTTWTSLTNWTIQDRDGI